LVREGAARATRYRLVEQCWDRTFALAGLEEDRVFAALAEDVPAIASLDSDATQTVGYIVTKLVNNAIDHSSGTKVDVRVRVTGDRLELAIEDDGVGAFAHVRDSLGLEDELAAIEQISKGKTTTDSERHTGEGLFFSSKAVDVFRLESGKFAWIVDNERGEFAPAPIPTRRARRVAGGPRQPGHPAPGCRSLNEGYPSDT
jgi:anti-sigma regulatory factor (Ser/Thr protein kinase)